MPDQLTIPTTRPRRPRVTCRVCNGTTRNQFGNPCAFCSGSGVARFTCPTCGEALPCCPCLGEYRGEARR